MDYQSLNLNARQYIKTQRQDALAAIAAWKHRNRLAEEAKDFSSWDIHRFCAGWEGRQPLSNIDGDIDWQFPATATVSDAQIAVIRRLQKRVRRALLAAVFCPAPHLRSNQ